MIRKIIGILVVVMLVGVLILPVTGKMEIDSKTTVDLCNIDCIDDYPMTEPLNEKSLDDPFNITVYVPDPPPPNPPKININIDLDHLNWVARVISYSKWLKAYLEDKGINIGPPALGPIAETIYCPIRGFARGSTKTLLEITSGNFDGDADIKFYQNNNLVGDIDVSYSLTRVDSLNFDATMEIDGWYEGDGEFLSTEGYTMKLQQIEPGYIEGTFVQSIVLQNAPVLECHVTRTYKYNTQETLPFDEDIVLEFENIQYDEDNDNLIFEANVYYTPSSDLKILDIGGGIGIGVEVENTGETDLEDIDWSISIDGFVILNSESNGTIDIPAGDGNGFNSGFVLGFGPIIVTVEVGNEKETVDGNLLLFFVLLN